MTPLFDARIEAFLADVLVLEGENPHAIHEGVDVALVDCEQIFKAREVNRRMKDKAAHACHARIVYEMQRQRGTATGPKVSLQPVGTGQQIAQREIISASCYLCP